MRLPARRKGRDQLHLKTPRELACTRWVRMPCRRQPDCREARGRHDLSDAPKRAPHRYAAPWPHAVARENGARGENHRVVVSSHPRPAKKRHNRSPAVAARRRHLTPVVCAFIQRMSSLETTRARGQVYGHLRVRYHKTHHLARSATQMRATRGLRHTVSRARKTESATIPGAYIPPPHLRGRAEKFSARLEEFSARLEKFSGRPGEFFGRAGDALGRPVGFCPRPEKSLGQPENSLPRDSAPVPRRRAFSAPPTSQCDSPHALNSPPAIGYGARRGSLTELLI